MDRLKAHISKLNFFGTFSVILIFMLIALILMLERAGVSYRKTESLLTMLPKEQVVTRKDAIKQLDENVLFIWDSSEVISETSYDKFKFIFDDMKVGLKEVDISKDKIPSYDNYEFVIVLLSDLTPMDEALIDLMDWVNYGGEVLFPLVLQKSAVLSVIEQKLGIKESSYENVMVDSLVVDDKFMVGGKEFIFEDPFESSWAVQLNQNTTKVYIHSGDEHKLPLLWETKYGEGKFVVCNIGIYEKYIRGIYSSAFSLLGDVGVYPVINASSFYLDDFPSEIPDGFNEYVKRDYNMSVRDFYINVWWPDMLNFADKYSIRYTGVTIGNYNDITDGSVEKNKDYSSFREFGNMLLRKNGEIGYHGYNHQPLCLDNCDYTGFYNYNTWDSYEAMDNAFSFLVKICEDSFPGTDKCVYVPPSNILSPEGERFLMNNFPEIKVIASIYFIDNFKYTYDQEFEVVSPTMVHEPRIISGCELSDYMKLAAFSELNYHYVNSHFTHPDDSLDPDRGAALGWEYLKNVYDEYLNWLFSSAKGLRNFTGSEFAGAIQRYSAITYYKEIVDNKLILHLGNFVDEAEFMMRFNNKDVGHIKGGELTHITGDLYLLKATDNKVEIDLL